MVATLIPVDRPHFVADIPYSEVFLCYGPDATTAMSRLDMPVIGLMHVRDDGQRFFCSAILCMAMKHGLWQVLIRWSEIR